MVKFSDEQFVRTWQTGKSVADVANKLGMTPYAACSYAYRLRKQGIKLDKYTKRLGPRRKIDVPKLKKLALELAMQ